MYDGSGATDYIGYVNLDRVDALGPSRVPVTLSFLENLETLSARSPSVAELEGLLNRIIQRIVKLLTRTGYKEHSTT